MQQPTEPSYALADTHDTRLDAGITKVARQNTAPSGFYLLSNGLDAFVTRLLLMEAAGASLDVQYYLFHDDTTAKLFAYYLLRAADRGARVRMLLDDFGHAGQEELKRGEIPMYWAKSSLIYDAPDKILNSSKDTNGHKAPELKKLLGGVHSEALIVSPYFIPGKSAVASLARWVKVKAQQ